MVIKPEDTDLVLKQVKDTWDKIKDRQFYTGCGKEECHWCNFVKTNNLAIALHDPEEDEEEQPMKEPDLRDN